MSQSTQNSRKSLGSHDRKLRLRGILENLSTLAEDCDNNDERIEQTSRAVRQAKALLEDGSVDERVEHPGESYLDSRVLRATSDLALRCSEAVSGNVNSYDRHQLAEYIKDNPQFLEVIFPREVPLVTSLYGSFDAIPVERAPRAARARQQRTPAAALKAPESVNQLQKADEGSALVEKVHSFVRETYNRRGKRPLSYFHLVLDPNSFSRTVENIYHVSFLARDGKVALEINQENSLPFVRPVSKSEREQNESRAEKQFIVSVDMRQWQELVKEFRIEEPMMVLQGRGVNAEPKLL